MLDPAAVQTLREALDHALGDDPDATDYGVLRHNVWTQAPAFERLLHGGALTRHPFFAGVSVQLFQDNLVWKPPGTGLELAWHQDYSYWPLDRPAGWTLWLALDDVDVENGCLHYLPGTHRLGERQPADFIRDAGQPEREDLPPLDWQERAHAAVAVPLRAGELVVHHPLIWHSSPPNRSSRERRALSVTLVDPAVTWDPDHAPHPYNWALNPGPGDALEGELFPVLPSVESSSSRG